MEEFDRIKRLPPYVFAEVNQIKTEARRAGEDVIDLGMGNPDLPTPDHIVDKLCEAAHKAPNHRYSASKGIPNLRQAIADWYARRYGVDIDPDSEAIATMGAKEGLAHLVLAMIRPGDVCFAPNPTYPIHPYSAIIAGGDVRGIPIEPGRDFFDDLMIATKTTWPKPKLLIISFPHNPTGQVVDNDFFQRIVDWAKEHNVWVIHDLAYADLTFDDYQAPSFLQAKGAKDVGVELFSMSKSYSMAGWRVGFCCGNQRMIHALTRIKSYLDYGMFQPIQIAAIIALNEDQSCVKEIVDIYRDRRDALVNGLERAGWPIDSPQATMFAWAKIPDRYAHLGSVEFAKHMIRQAKVAVAPGMGFGDYGDNYVRFALVENNNRIAQACRGIKQMLGEE